MEGRKANHGGDYESVEGSFRRLQDKEQDHEGYRLSYYYHDRHSRMEKQKIEVKNMPYKKSEFTHIRIHSPSIFIRGTFRTKKIGKHGEEITLGKRRSTGKWEVQRFLIPKTVSKTHELKLKKLISKRHHILEID